MTGLIHIYCGDGKGKTTASIGLAVRAAGAGKKVVFTQFFKDGSSSEMKTLAAVPEIELIHCKKKHGFFFRMDEQQKAEAARDYTDLLQTVLIKGRHADLLILDEIISACNHGTVPEHMVLEFLRNKPDGLEVVLTGRNPSERLAACADYMTEMKKIKHPFDQGIPARKGIEY